MDHHSSIYADWENFWQRRDSRTLVGHYITRRKLDHIRRLLNKLAVTRGIDVGCGSGATLQLLSELTGNAVGLDISPTAVAKCRAKGLRAFQENFLDHQGRYDLVFSDGLIEHFEDFRPFIAALCRMSTRYILIVQIDHSTAIIKLLSRIERRVKRNINVHEYPHPISSFIEEFRARGFTPASRSSILMGGVKLLLFTKAGVNSAEPHGELQ